MTKVLSKNIGPMFISRTKKGMAEETVSSKVWGNEVVWSKGLWMGKR